MTIPPSEPHREGVDQVRAAVDALAVTEPPRKPDVTVFGGRVSITESSVQLFRAIGQSRRLYYRGGAVVELVDGDHGAEFSVVDATAATSRFEGYVNFKAIRRTEDGPQLVPTTITEQQARQYLKSTACREQLPNIRAILSFPVLVERNGQLETLENGFDQGTGYFVQYPSTVEDWELGEATNFIQQLLQGFDFETDADFSRAVASFLTPALKFSGLIQGQIPIDVAEANESQSGKTYRQKLVAAAYNHNLASVTQVRAGVGSMEETFCSHLIKGRPFIQIDNVRGKLDSPRIEAFATADGTFNARASHTLNVDVDPSKFVLFISSNGFEATKDLANRASIIRIRRRHNHVFPTHNGMDLLRLVRTQSHLVQGAIARVIAEWYYQGKPRTQETRHSFQEWCQSLDWIVKNLFAQAPLMDNHQEAKERAANPNLSFLRMLAVRLEGRNQLNTPLSASNLVETCNEEELPIPRLKDSSNDEAARKLIGTIMSQTLKTGNEVVIEGYRIERQVQSANNASGNWQESKTYIFARLNAPPPP